MEMKNNQKCARMKEQADNMTQRLDYLMEKCTRNTIQHSQKTAPQIHRTIIHITSYHHLSTDMSNLRPFCVSPL